MTERDASTGSTRLDVVLGCADLDEMVAFLQDRVGGRVISISPADDPREVVVDVAGTCVRLVRGGEGGGTLILHDPDVGTGGRPPLRAPNGTVVEFRNSGTEVVVPAAVPSLSIVEAGDRFGVGRAGMGYRDLLPDRWGGRFVASHIRIADGGDVPDYVHFHRIRFQMIFCARGWVDLVYEDQGEPFRLHAGDCVLQPPEIRHRVLRSSPGLEVIEIGCPAVHDTLVEHDIELPTARTDPGRDFGGQRFVRHVADEAERAPWLVDGITFRDTGIGAASDRLAGAVVLEARGVPADATGSPPLTYGGEFCMYVVLRGGVTLSIDGGPARRMQERDAVALPPDSTWSWSEWAEGAEVLQVTLPAETVRQL